MACFVHFLEFDLNTLDAIKKDKPYDSLNQYLEINYRLLREECFRNLSTGIQKLSRNKSYDPRMMKLFRCVQVILYLSTYIVQV